MRLWMDNTGLHSVGLCLAGQARSDVDVEGLLQFATFAGFSDSLLVNGFESVPVAQRTEQICADLPKPDDAESWIIIVPENEKSYALACETAAEDAATDMANAFCPSNADPTGLAPADIPVRFEKAQEAILDLARKDGSLQRLEETRRGALSDRAAGAVHYMLACSADLRKAVRQISETYAPLSSVQVRQLNAFLRYYLNDALAGQNFARYSPAVARAKALRTHNEDISARLDRRVSEVVTHLQGHALGVPAIVGSLIQRAKGDPRALIEEALHAREASWPLRRWLSRRLSRADSESPEGQFTIDSTIGEIVDLLRQDLGLDKAPRFWDALEVLFVLGVPVPSLSGGKLMEWAEWRWKRRKVAVLSSLSKSAAYPRDEDAFKKLVDNCFKNRDD